MSSLPVLTAPDFLRDATGPVPCTTQPCLFHSDDQADIERAVDLCLDCPLMLACRDWARAHGEHGVAGGETEQERIEGGRKPVMGATINARAKGCGSEAGAKRHRRLGEAVCSYCLEAERTAFRERREARAERDAAAWPPHLTPQELLILQAIADLGDDTGKVGEHLGLARKAITTATYKLRKKLRTDNPGLIPTARAAGLLPAAPTAEYEVAA